MIYFVYIIQSKKDKSYYIGSTDNVIKRVKDHNNGKSKYTNKKKPYILKWFCAFCNKMQALRFEKYLKSGSGSAFFRKHFI